MYAQEKEEEKTIVDTSETKVLVSTPKRFYMGNGYDFLMLSSAIYDNGIDNKITIPRFTGVVNLGVNFHFDPNKRIGFFTGIGLKNLGFIEKFKEPTGDITTTKRRVYSIGVPLGIKVLVSTPKRFYMGNGYDFLMLSSAIYDNGIDNKITIPRFTGVVNLGVNFHFDPNKRIGFFTGIGLKNLGFIEKNPFPGAVTNKYRVYTIGVPIGLKIGDLRNRNFLFGGGGVDFPFHY